MPLITAGTITYGTSNILEVYQGEDLIWPLEMPSSGDYLQFEIVSNGGTITWNTYGTYSAKTISYSTDSGATWSSITTTEGVSPSINTYLGETILLRGFNKSYWDGDIQGGGHHYFGGTASFNIKGNIMSLIYGNRFNKLSGLTERAALYGIFKGSKAVDASGLILPEDVIPDWGYCCMFENCTSLQYAPNMPAISIGKYSYGRMFYGCSSLWNTPVISATTVASGSCVAMFEKCTSLYSTPSLPATDLTGGDRCYAGMFKDCTSLISASTLPATTLEIGCYGEMFSGCTSLTTAPVLPATNLAVGCYGAMFYNCTSLTTAPDLPSTYLVGDCYDNMFYGCSRLNYIKCLAESFSPYSPTSDWLVNVASNGTFVKSSNMSDWTTGSSGIPSGWTIIDN